MKKGKKITFAFIFRTVGVLLIATLLLSILWVAYYSQFEVRKTPQMVFYKFGKEQHDLKIEYQWIPLDSISRNMIIAVLAAEDKDFYIHDGFAPLNDSDSVLLVIPKEHETITQKTAHTVFLTRGDSWTKNILEPYYTILEEYLWGKDRILEIYMNTALFGNGIFGVEAASHIYFNKSVGDLTAQEAAFLAALMESPETTNLENVGEELQKRQKEILMEMGLMMYIKIGKKPVGEEDKAPVKPTYKRQWRG